MIELDNIDIQILGLMQDNARISNAASRIKHGAVCNFGACKKAGAKKVITGYYTKINPVALGKKLLAFILI